MYKDDEIDPQRRGDVLLTKGEAIVSLCFVGVIVLCSVIVAVTVFYRWILK